MVSSCCSRARRPTGGVAARCRSRACSAVSGAMISCWTRNWAKPSLNCRSSNMTLPLPGVRGKARGNVCLAPAGGLDSVLEHAGGGQHAGGLLLDALLLPAVVLDAQVAAGPPVLGE